MWMKLLKPAVYAMGCLAAAVVALGLFLVVIFLIVFVDITKHERSPRPDAELIAIFQRHRAEFDTLKGIFLEDSLEWLAPARDSVEDSTRLLTPERRARYDRLLERLELHEGMSSCGDHCVRFKSTAEGTTLFANMREKGYVFDSTDTGHRCTQELASLDDWDAILSLRPCRKIESRWYLALELER